MPTTTSTSTSTTNTKRVRWSTITIHEFGVGHGGSAVPKSGPSIGLARTPEFTWSTRVGSMASECDGVRRFTSAERVTLLQSAGFSRDCVDAFVADAKRVRSSRELYYSSEMKRFRKKRKLAKADARATRRKLPDQQADAMAIVAVGEDDDALEMKAPAPLRITSAAAPSASQTVVASSEEEEETTVATCAPLLPQPQPLPLSPCCS